MIGGLEILKPIGDRLGMIQRRRLRGAIGAINDDSVFLGYVSIGIFVLSWLGLLVFYNLKGYDQVRSIRPGEADASGIAAPSCGAADNRQGNGQFRPLRSGMLR